MSKPKLLTIFDDTSSNSIYSKFNNPVTATISGNSIIVSETIEVQDKSVVTFKAPAASQGITKVVINNVTYNLLNPAGESISTTSSFSQGACISLILDTINKNAYLQGAASYFTDEVKNELVNEVIAALPVYTGEIV